MRRQPESAVTLAGQVLDDVSLSVDAWAGAKCTGDVFSWLVDVDPDEFEYLTNALYNLDLRRADEAGRAAPAEAPAFHLMLVRALLFALAQDGPSRSAFVEQLRPSWPVAADVR